jgi:hypothetical protein
MTKEHYTADYRIYEIIMETFTEEERDFLSFIYDADPQNLLKLFSVHNE